MACSERCLMGLLAGLVVFLIAAALHPRALETVVARTIVELPLPTPKQSVSQDVEIMALAVAAVAPDDVAAPRAKSRKDRARRTRPTETPAVEHIPLPPPAAPNEVPKLAAGPGAAADDAAAVSRLSANLLSEAFDDLGYDLKSVGGGGRVPRLFLTNVPHDMGSIREGQVRKSVFLKTVLPLILQVNEEIDQERSLLWRLRQKMDQGVSLRAAEKLWLQTMADRYAVEDADVDVLLRKVDIIPPSLALAQAAEESGWGTSRYAREGNALFGEGAYSDGRPVQVRTFENLLDAVRGYARNLNSHSAYRDFRNARNTMRQRGRPLDGHALAGFILRYSERGENYIKSLRVIISANNLRGLDKAELHDELTINADPLLDPTI